jgi:cytochrome b subunit of formate dehydrogenase
MTMRQARVQTHSLPVRIGHWLMALSILIMIGSGWRIYNYPGGFWEDYGYNWFKRLLMGPRD